MFERVLDTPLYEVQNKKELFTLDLSQYFSTKIPNMPVQKLIEKFQENIKCSRAIIKNSHRYHKLLQLFTMSSRYCACNFAFKKNFVKKRPSKNFARKFLRTAFFIEHFWWLLLNRLESILSDHSSGLAFILRVSLIPFFALLVSILQN